MIQDSAKNPELCERNLEMIDELELSQSPPSYDLLYNANMGPNVNSVQGKTLEVPSITIDDMDPAGSGSKK